MFKKGQSVKANGSGRIHIITDIRKDINRMVAGWGCTTVEDTYIQVDHQIHANGKPFWQAWGNFQAL